MKKLFLPFTLSVLLFIFCPSYLFAQTGVAISALDNPVADPSAMLDVSSTSKGALVPRMTTAQRDAIASPTTGLLIYNTITNQFNYFDGTAWSAAVGPQGPQGPAGILPNGTAAGNTPYWNGTAWVTNSSNLHNNGGNIGIGTTSPSAKLHVVGSSNPDPIWFGTGAIAYPTTPSGGINFVGRSTTSDFRLGLQDGNARVSQYWNAYMEGSLKYIVSSEPAARMVMHVGTNGYWTFYGAPAGTAGSAITWTQGAYIEPNNFLWLSPRGTSSDLYIPASTGNVGIGTTTPGQKLEVSGGVKVGSSASGTAGTIQWTGTDLQVHNGTAWKSLTSGSKTVTYYSASTPVQNIYGSAQFAVQEVGISVNTLPAGATILNVTLWYEGTFSNQQSTSGSTQGGNIAFSTSSGSYTNYVSMVDKVQLGPNGASFYKLTQIIPTGIITGNGTYNAKFYNLKTGPSGSINLNGVWALQIEYQ